MRGTRFLDLGLRFVKPLIHRGVTLGIVLLGVPALASSDVCLEAADRAVIAAGFSHGAQPSWQRRVRASALLPSVRARATYQTGGGQYWPSGEAVTDWSYRAGHQTQVSIDLQWDLSNLAWRHDELAVSREILRVREKRADLVAEILQLCLEYERLGEELLATPTPQRPPLAHARRRLAAQLVARGAFERSPPSP